MSLIPGLTFESKRKEVLNFGPDNIFCPIDKYKLKPNKKYMFSPNQFKSRDPPILTFFSSYDNRGDSPRDEMKFRKCNILYFVEDATIKVYEPKQRNSGFDQGCIISRNKIPNPEGGFYELEDLNVGKTVSFFGKSFKIFDCDPFTRNYMREMGYRVGTPEPEIIDPVYADRQELDKFRTTIHKPRVKEYKLAKFIKCHPKYLHFYVIYNYSPRHFQDIRYASLYYNVLDYKIKIIDEKKMMEYKRQISIGNYDTYLILKPTLVPKTKTKLNIIGDNSNPIILNFGATSRQMHLQELMKAYSAGANNQSVFLRDSNPDKSAENPEEYYTAKDFDLGITINIFGSQVYIYDCDEFTKEFYRNEFDKELVPVPLPDIKEVKYPKLVYKGNFGNPEDSLQTCFHIPFVNIPKKSSDVCSITEKSYHKGSHSDKLLKFYFNCRQGLDGKILKFLSRALATNNLLGNKYFTIQWFLEDNTIQIYGLDLDFTLSDSSEAMFMKRRKLIKPTSELENAGTCYYSETDMFIGNVIYAMMKVFLITDADEYTFDYMERNSDIYIHSNIKYIMSHIYPLLRDKISILEISFTKYDLDETGFVSYENFKTILFDLLPKGFDFPEHEIKTLARHFAYEEYIGLNLDHLISRIQSEIKKERFDDFEKLKTLFRIFDQDNSDSKGCIKPARVYEILRSFPLPVDRDLLKSFVFKFPQSNGLISYDEIVRCLNYFDNPSKPPDLSPYAINLNWERAEKVKNLNKISYSSLLKELATENCPNCK